jgi:hypothetical protein
MNLGGVLLITALAGLPAGICQEIKEPDLVVYEKLFGAVASWSNRPPEEGQSQPVPKEVLNLTDEEWESVKVVSEDWVAVRTKIDEVIRALVFDLRLAAAGDEPTDELRDRLRDIERRRGQAAAEYVDRLRAALGARFEDVQSFLESKGTGPLFPQAPRGIAR